MGFLMYQLTFNNSYKSMPASLRQDQCKEAGVFIYAARGRIPMYISTGYHIYAPFFSMIRLDLKNQRHIFRLLRMDGEPGFT